MNYLSAHPKRMKENIAIELVNRVMSLSDPIFKPMNIRRIKEKLRKNNYPMRIIHKAFETYKYKQELKRQQSSNQQSTSQDPSIKQQVYRSMPYVPHLSQAVNRQLKLANPDLTIAPKQIKQLGNIFTKTKTKIPTIERTDAIYRVGCKANLCPEPVYIGETERTPKKRAVEHARDYKNRNNPGNKTALTKHALNFPGHEPQKTSEF